MRCHRQQMAHLASTAGGPPASVDCHQRVAQSGQTKGQGPDDPWATYPLALQDALMQSEAGGAGRLRPHPESQQPRSAHVRQRAAAGGSGPRTWQGRPQEKTSKRVVGAR